MKKITAILVALLLLVTCFSICACACKHVDADNDGICDKCKKEIEKEDPGPDENALAGTYDVTLWVSEISGVTTLTEQQIDAFEAANPGIIINATVEGVSEGESATQMVTSVEDGADIFCFAQDQLARLVLAGALNKLGVAASKEVTDSNDSGAVAAATVGGELYCYPLTSDNGYFMYYDTRVIAADHLDSLEEIIADCEAADKMFSYQLEGSAWYNAGFFFATGCHSNWTTNSDGDFTAVDDTFNSDAGVIALKGMQKLLKSTCYNNSNAASDFSAAIPSAVVVSGTWDTTTATEALGENLGIAALPSFTVGENTYHLGSYAGNKLLGVKPTVDAKRAAVLQKLALYLAGETCQKERFETLGWGPSNLNVQNTDAVKDNKVLAALAAQSPYAVPQGQIHGSWWDIGKVYATTAKTATTDAELIAALAKYEESINGLFSISADVKEAFTVIGGMGGDGWATDIAMTQKPAGTWYSAAILFAAGDEFKVRQGLSWDVAFGTDGGNYVVPEAGYYFVKLVYDKEAGTGIVTVEKTSPILGFTVIGSMNGDTWSIDIEMEIQADGSWLTTAPITFADGDEFKVRQGKAWDVAYGVGTANYKVGATEVGSFNVKLVIAENVGTVTLVPVE